MRGILYFILADKNRDSVKEYTYMEIELVEVQANGILELDNNN